MITTYRYGEPRGSDALRIGVARQPPRGTRRQDYAKRNYLDLWLRVLGPSSELMHLYRSGKISFRQFAARYRREMNRPESRQVIDLVALLSRTRPISIGCYCEHEDRCHRSVLKQLLDSAVSALPDRIVSAGSASGR